MSSREPGRASAEITGVNGRLALDTLYIQADLSAYCVSRGGPAHKEGLSFSDELSSILITVS